jgi:hypothetical protein
MERFAPGAWTKTIRERAAQIKALFQHGGDPQIGDKPLGPFHRSRRTTAAATRRSRSWTRPITGICCLA